MKQNMMELERENESLKFTLGNIAYIDKWQFILDVQAVQL